MIRPTDPASPASLPVRSVSPVIVSAPAHEPHGQGFSRAQRFWKNTAWPLVTSLSLHAGLVVICLLLFTAYKAVIHVPAPQLVIVPTGGVEPVQPIVKQGPLTDPFPNIKPTDNPLSMPGLKSTNPGAQVNLIRVALGGSESAIGPALDPSRTAVGKGSGGTERPGGPIRGFGGTQDSIFNRGGPPGGPPNRLPLSTAYVCDASGSMMEKMPALKQELENAVDGLHPFQKFSITFFQDEQPIMLSSQLLLATTQSKRAAEEFLVDVNTSGKTNPIPGIEKAFAQGPQVMYLLTDGDFPNNDAVLAEIRRLEKQRHVEIDTIAFVSSSDTDTQFLTLLEQVASETGGTFKKVDVASLDPNGK